MTWNNTPQDISKYLGFVYLIKNNVNGKYYIGKKQFWKKKTLPPLKGKKNKRHSQVESDWKDYWGSCNELHADIEKYGKERYSRYMMHYCRTKWELSYMELVEQMNHKVLLDPNSYNGIVNVRLRKLKTIDIKSK